MANLSEDLILEMFRYIHVDQIKDMCYLDRALNDYCKDPIHKNRICLIFINKYKIDYVDPNNFIYKYNNQDINDYKNSDGTWKLQNILKLYSRTFYLEMINCNNLGITSFPIYPNMKIFYGNNNHLTSFPIQPQMQDFYGANNQLTEFPVQPRMVMFDAENNNLTRFPHQPNMIVCIADAGICPEEDNTSESSFGSHSTYPSPSYTSPTSTFQEDDNTSESSFGSQIDMVIAESSYPSPTSSQN
jgi:hypothetical protein